MNICQRIILSALCLFLAMAVQAQRGKKEAEGISYYLPQTKLCFTVRVEKTVYTPGELSAYAERYMKLKNVEQRPSESYRIIGFDIYTEGERDTAKLFVAPTDAKHSITRVALDDNAVITAVNTDPRQVKVHKPFVPADKPAPLNPRDFMNEDILTAASSAKMAELCAVEIYDIRESKNLLNKGQAEFMPKDGEQLRIMLRNLETQERALMQLFSGVTQRDTLEEVLEIVPQPGMEKQVLFRFSKHLGMTDVDDLAGAPFYIDVEDRHQLATAQEAFLADKAPRDNVGLYANLPGKIKVEVLQGSKPFKAYELYAAQYGQTVQLHPDLFGSKMITTLVINPVTGNLENLHTDLVKK